MNKDEFLSRLRKKLRKLPKDDIDDAVEYYEEYLEDAGPENETDVINGWGSPDRVASQILADYAVKQMGKDPSARRGISTVWLVILAIFASPLAIPLAAVVAIFLLIFAAVVFIAIACIYAVAVFIAAVGIFAFITGIFLFSRNFANAVFYTGAGLFAGGAGAAIFVFAVWFSKKGFSFIAKIFGGFVNKFIKRRSSN